MTVNTGVVITVATGALNGSPAPTILVRMSRSVTIPKPPLRRLTIAELAPASVIRRATSRMLSIGSHRTVGERSSRVTGRWFGGPAPTSTERCLTWSSTGRATLTGIR